MIFSGVSFNAICLRIILSIAVAKDPIKAKSVPICHDIVVLCAYAIYAPLKLTIALIHIGADNFSDKKHTPRITVKIGAMCPIRLIFVIGIRELASTKQKVIGIAKHARKICNGMYLLLKGCVCVANNIHTTMNNRQN